MNDFQKVISVSPFCLCDNEYYNALLELLQLIPNAFYSSFLVLQIYFEIYYFKFIYYFFI